MSRHLHELPIPDPAPQDPRARELVRIWEHNDEQQVSLSPLLWDDPGPWGIALVDMAKLIADAYSEAGQIDSATALDRIKQGFDLEWGDATDNPKGRLIDRFFGRR